MLNTNYEVMKDILVAIRSVRRRAVIALRDGDYESYRERIGDLLGLESCLVIEAEKFVGTDNLKELS